MNDYEVSLFARSFSYQGDHVTGSIEQTHISWVILTSAYAFKIKKPVKFNFLDFSTLALRQYFCEKEVNLNKRLTDIYLSAEPVRKVNEICSVGGDTGEIIDYCVVMKRMSIAKRMDNQLKKGAVKEDVILALAQKIAHFHKHAIKVVLPFDLEKARNTFNDLSVIRPLGDSYFSVVNRAIALSNDFLERHASRIQQRINQGLNRDVHGDLHAGNIFLYPDPVIFDCVEFNDQYRQIDVLYDIAFLCMDLDFFYQEHQKHLSEIFLAEYQSHFPAFQTTEDHALFRYYKALRANVRAKVYAIRIEQTKNKKEKLAYLNSIHRYLSMINHYLIN